MLSKKKKLLVILGPTATGKTDLALYLAKKFNGELISCDSRQVYVGLDIGTGKMPKNEYPQIKYGKGFWEIGGIKVWLYDIANPRIQYSVANYVKDAKFVINKIHKSGKRPIIVGGSGLYLRALLEGLPNLTIPMDQGLRKQLEALSLLELQKRLREVSSKRFENMNSSDKQNSRRLIRAIEMINMYPYKNTTHIVNPKFQQFSSLKIGLNASRNILYKRIDERVNKRISQGMVEEVIELRKKSLSLSRMRQLGLEYGVLADYLDKKINGKDELIRVLQYKIHGYLRRQLTWFKKEKDVNWFNIEDKDYNKKIENRVAKWYDV